MTDETSKDTVKQDAEGQFHRSKKGRDNDGAASAEPRVLGDGERNAHDWKENADDKTGC